jgi:hypothetical protein
VTRLPYTAVTSAGEAFDIQFPLHSETRSAQAVADLLTSVLGAISARVELGRAVSNGDVLQALAMAMAVRARMVAVPPKTSLNLMHGLVDASFAATLSANRYQGGRG